MNNSGAVLIPARYQSSRFPGKPLADICGKPMIQWVYERCILAVGREKVYVATDSEEIESCVKGFSGKVIRTSVDCLTGTDRLSEANRILDLDFVVNVQGDEPLVQPEDIRKVFNYMSSDASKVVNCYCEIEQGEVGNPSVPKVVVSESRKLIYMSRSGVPFDKKLQPNAMYKQVCIYGFGRGHLKQFAARDNKTVNENFEDIEILRYLDMDVPVQMLEVKKGNVAVDTPGDLARVRKIMNETLTSAGRTIA